MSDLDKFWDDADEGSGEYTPLPMGQYNAEVTGAVHEAAKDGKAARVVFEYTVSDGDHSGRKLWENANLTENGIWVLKKNAKILGLSSDGGVDGVLSSLAEARGAHVELKVTHNKKGDKTYVNAGLLKRVEIGETAPF